MRLSRWLSVTAVSVCLSGTAHAADAPAKEIASFGSLQAPTVDAAKAQAAAWYAKAGGKDQAKFDAIWATDRPMIDKVADTLALGNPEAAKILKQARHTGAPAEGVPALLDKKKNPDLYMRSNLGLAYAKALSVRRAYEEAQKTLETVKGEDVVDPANYFFTRALAEYSLMERAKSQAAILRLLEDVIDSPERYRQVAALMVLDMDAWQDNDLGWISRKMNVIADRLDIQRGGEKTRRMQKEVLVRLEEMIKEKENQQKQQQQQQQGPPKDGPPNDGACPPGGPPKDGQPGNTAQPSSPQQDSYGGNAPGKGVIDPKEKAKVTKEWGNLPEKDRAKAVVGLTRELPKEMRDSLDIYLKKLAEKNADKK